MPYFSFYFDIDVKIIPYSSIVLHSQYLFLAGQALISDHPSVTPLVAAYANHSCKWPAPVTDTFFASRGCPLMRASTVLQSYGNFACNDNFVITLWELYGKHHTGLGYQVMSAGK